MKSESTTICFRVTEDTRRVLNAVAFADLVSKQSDASTGQVNLSEFVRDVLEDFVATYTADSGGVEAVLEHYRQAEVRELEVQLARVKALPALTDQLGAQPARRRGRASR